MQRKSSVKHPRVIHNTGPTTLAKKWVRYAKGPFPQGSEGLLSGRKPSQLSDGRKRYELVRSRPSNPSMLKPKSAFHSGLTEQIGSRQEAASNLRMAKFTMGRRKAVKIMREGRKLSGY